MTISPLRILRSEAVQDCGFRVFEIKQAQHGPGAAAFSSGSWSVLHASASKPADKSSAPAKPASQILDENRSSIAVIVAGGNTLLRLGTGFFVGSTGLLLTNFHVVDGMDLVGVKIPGSDDVLWAKKATGFDVDNDLVVHVLGDSQREYAQKVAELLDYSGLQKTRGNPVDSIS